MAIVLSSASKYKSKKVEVDGHVFDSKIEAKYYEQLKWLQNNKQILFFRLQPRYLLQEAFEKDGKSYRKIEYIADFEPYWFDQYEKKHWVWRSLDDRNRVFEVARQNR